VPLAVVRGACKTLMKAMKNKKLIYPQSIGWEVTVKCNHQCFFCYNNKNLNESIDDNSYEKICDFIISKRPNSVGITGGEPLLVFEKIKNSIIRLRSAGIYVRVTSNGSLITQEIAEFFEKYDIEVMISFPSINRKEFEQITNSVTYDAVIKGINILSECGVRIFPNIVVSKINLHSIKETACFLTSNYKIKKLFISRMTSSDAFSLSKDDFDFFFDTCVELNKNIQTEVSSCGGYPFCMFNSQEIVDIFAKGCGIGNGGFLVDTSGNIRVCARDSTVYGNIYTEDYELIMNRIIIEIDDAAVIPLQCSDCNVKKYCRGGCSINAKKCKAATYNSVDSDARFDRLPFKYSLSKRIYYSPFKQYAINKPLNILFDGIGNRVSRRIGFLYLSSLMTEYIKKYDKISVAFIMLLQKANYKNACDIMRKLIRFEIVDQHTK